jgi:hypothetical protein
MNTMKRTGKMLSLLGIVVLMALCYACPSSFYPKKKFPVGVFPDTVCNLSLANSCYDDINMTLMEVNCTNFLVFSSNRLTNGGTFDLVSNVATFSWDQVDGNFEVKTNVYELDEFVEQMANATRTDADEFGPLFFSQVIWPKTGNSYEKYFLFYSDDEKGKQDVRFFEFDRKYNSQITASFADSLKKKKNTVTFLSNPNFNEGYISFQTDQYPLYDPYRYPNTTIFQKLVYCNDSLGNYDIFSIDIPQNIPLDSFLLQKANVTKTNLKTVNSPFNDRCPNVNQNFMVFSSNRPGGLGGYDFYYSVFENGQWGQPVNFGAPINSAYDEFRAIAVKADGYENNVLIFSSNRPGGKGGYDIYYTGIDMMPKIK